MLPAEIGGKQLFALFFRRGVKELLETFVHFPRHIADETMSICAQAFLATFLIVLISAIGKVKPISKTSPLPLYLERRPRWLSRQ